MFIGELPIPDFDRALERVRSIGPDHVLVHSLGAEGSIGELTDAQADRFGKRLEAHGVRPLLIGGNVFKEVHLADLEIDTMAEHPQFKQHFARLVRGMQIGDRLGFRDVCAFTFAWPGEYTAGGPRGRGSPTWPMRWATRGGIIGSTDMDKLEKGFTLMLEQAERYDVNLVLMQMPWNYTNTTGNFRRIAERLASPRIRVMWGPADNVNCGESDVATVGFRNVRPYVHGLHMKDLRVNCGAELDFTYCPIGEGHTHYETVLRNLHEHGCPAYLSVASHYVPPGRDRSDPEACEEALRANYRTVSALVDKVTA
jgi:sugar phosphate isomerase/epimerase